MNKIKKLNIKSLAQLGISQQMHPTLTWIWSKISVQFVNELQVEYNLNNSEFVDKGRKNYFLYSTNQQSSEN